MLPGASTVLMTNGTPLGPWPVVGIESTKAFDFLTFAVEAAMVVGL